MRLPLTSHLMVALAFVPIGLLIACGKQPGQQPPGTLTPEVGVIEVKLQSVAFTTELPGRTVPFLIADVRPQISGIIQKRSFQEGSDVKAGEVLYIVNPALYKAAHEINLAALSKAQATLKGLRLKSHRYKELVLINAVSKQDYDDTISSLEQGEADVASAKANFESSRINLDHTRIEAPISGRVGRSNFTPGALVTDSQADELTTIQQLDPIYVDVTQSSVALLHLKQAMASGELRKSGANSARVQLRLEDGSVYPLEGALEFSGVTVDQNTGTITLRALFPNPKGDLLPGMYVRALLQEGIKDDGLLVPQQAVSRDTTGKPVAYIVNADNKLERRLLKTERAVGDLWLISSGLKVGEKLVVDGQQRASSGIVVTTVPWQAAPVKADPDPTSSPLH